MMNWIRVNVKIVGIAALAALIAFVVFSISRYVAGKDRRIADLLTQLATAEQTVEIERGLYARKAAEVSQLADLVSKLTHENSKLSELIRAGEMEVLTLNRLVMKWKKAYEGALAASQTHKPPPTPDSPSQIRVDFKGRFPPPNGPFLIEGHTLTGIDGIPPSSYLRLSQVEPLRMTIAVTRNRNGTFSTIVDSDDANVEVDVTFAAVDPKVLREKWYQRIWADASLSLLGESGGHVGLSYRGQRLSGGINCGVYGTTAAWSCGISVGARIFK